MNPNPSKYRAEPCGCGCGQSVYVLKWARKGVRRTRFGCAQRRAAEKLAARDKVQQ